MKNETDYKKNLQATMISHELPPTPVVNIHNERAQTSFSESTGSSMIFRGEQLQNADFAECNLRRSDFSEANLQGAMFRQSDCRKSNFFKANLQYVNFLDANLREASLAGAKLNGANLSGADLRGADLRGADLSFADLSGANLTDANLAHVNIKSAVLRGTHFAPLSLVPDEGSFYGWIPIGTMLGKVLIPAEAVRKSQIGNRVCLADQFILEKVFTVDGNQLEYSDLIEQGCIGIAHSIGFAIYPESFMDDWEFGESGWLSFYLTKTEAIIALGKCFKNEAH